jgi:hypothetical protein
MEDMSRFGFTVAFDGPSVEDGKMDVRDLAPTLLSLSSLIDAANVTLNGEDSKINVNVTATSPGCFEISLEVVQQIWEHLIPFLSGDGVTSAINLMELLGLASTSVGGLVLFLKMLKGRTPSKIKDLKNGNVEITVDGETFTVPLKLLRLYQDIQVRNAVSETLEKPFERGDLDAITFKAEGKTEVSVRIEKSEAKFFTKPDIPDETLLSDERRSAFSILSLAFKEDNKWRLHDGNSAISALITDEDFLRRVDGNQISFSKGDILVCDVVHTQTQTKEGLKTEYVVEKVVDHKRAARQLLLPIEEVEEDDQPTEDEKPLEEGEEH